MRKTPDVWDSFILMAQLIFIITIFFFILTEITRTQYKEDWRCDKWAGLSDETSRPISFTDIQIPLVNYICHRDIDFLKSNSIGLENLTSCIITNKYYNETMEYTVVEKNKYHDINLYCVEWVKVRTKVS